MFVTNEFEGCGILDRERKDYVLNVETDIFKSENVRLRVRMYTAEESLKDIAEVTVDGEALKRAIDNCLRERKYELGWHGGDK